MLWPWSRVWLCECMSSSSSPMWKMTAPSSSYSAFSSNFILNLSPYFRLLCSSSSNEFNMLASEKLSWITEVGGSNWVLILLICCPEPTPLDFLSCFDTFLRAFLLCSLEELFFSMSLKALSSFRSSPDEPWLSTSFSKLSWLLSFFKVDSFLLRELLR